MDHANSAPYKFTALYKNNDELSKKQQQRRIELLTNRLSKRDKLISSIRRLVSDVASDDEHDNNNTTTTTTTTTTTNHNNNTITQSSPNNASTVTPMQTTPLHQTIATHSSVMMNSSPSPVASPCSSSSSNKSTSGQIEDRKFRNKAMLSEWLVDRPMDFESEWLLKPTPVGRRCLVFSRKGETVAYSRKGTFIKAFQSSLPGGSHMHISHCRRQFAIVDCIFVQHTNTFYLMDALAWNQQKLFESEAEFRFFWLQSRYTENQAKFITVSTKNECRFYCLNTYTASDQDILTALENDPLIKEHNLQLDGLLFFHIRGPYVSGANPLVLWIKPDMVNRVLSVNCAPRS